MLVGGAARGKRRGAGAVLAQALGPELAEPQAEGTEPVAIGHQHRGREVVLAQQADGDGGADGGGAVRRLARRERRVEHRLSAGAQRPPVEAGGERRQQSARGQRRVAPGNVRVVVEDHAAVALGKAAQGRLGGLGDYREALAGAVAQGLQHHQGLGQGLGRGARLGNGDEAAAPGIEAIEQRLEAHRVDVVGEVEPGAGGAVGQGAQRAAAEARAAGAEHHHVVERLAQAPTGGLDGRQVVLAPRHVEHGQAARRALGAQIIEHLAGLAERPGEGRLAEPAVADAGGEAVIDVMSIGNRHPFVLRGHMRRHRHRRNIAKTNAPRQRRWPAVRGRQPRS